MAEARRPDIAAPPSATRSGLLDWLERNGNRLPDPAALFLIVLLLLLGLSVLLAPVSFTDVDPRTVKRDASGAVISSQPIRVINQLTPDAIIQFLSRMVKNYTDFPPLGVVLVTMLGMSVAECTGYIRASLKFLLKITPARLLTPAVLLMAIVGHSAGDSSFVLVLPLGGLAFAAAGRHPIAGITVAFAGVSGGLSANFLPSTLDLLLQGFTQGAAQLIQPSRTVNALCNWYFMSASCLVIVGLGWLLNDRWLEPRLNRILPVDGEPEGSSLQVLTPAEARGFAAGTSVLVLFLGALAYLAWPANSILRSPSGSLTAPGAPLMEMIVPIITFMGVLPGVVHGYVSGSIQSHHQIIRGVAGSMNTMGYYLLMAFCAAMFTTVFRESNLGALLAIKGAKWLADLGLPGVPTIVGVILLTALVDFFIGSASAKWAFLAPILVPMLMQLGYAPELTLAAYRIGDSATNIVTPLMPYFGLVVMQCQRHSKTTGMGTLLSTMAPYAITFLIFWTLLLLAWWGLRLPLGIQGHYAYP